MTKFRDCIGEFSKQEFGAALIEYAVALIVVTLVAGFIFALGADIAILIDVSAGAF